MPAIVDASVAGGSKGVFDQITNRRGFELE